MTIKIDEKTIRLYYYRFRNSDYYSLSIYLGVIIVCLFIVGLLLIPQINKLFSIENETAVERSKIATIQNNLSYITTINTSELDDNLATAYLALPIDRDPSGIIQAISDAALASGVMIDDYTIRVGNVSSSTSLSQKNQSPIDVSLSISNNTLSQIQKFTEEIQKKLPLAEVVKTEIIDKVTTINLAFYYKPLPVINIDDTQPIQPLSKTSQSLLTNLRSWQSGSEYIVNPMSTSSSSFNSPF